MPIKKITSKKVRLNIPPNEPKLERYRLLDGKIAFLLSENEDNTVTVMLPMSSMDDTVLHSPSFKLPCCNVSPFDEQIEGHTCKLISKGFALYAKAKTYDKKLVSEVLSKMTSCNTADECINVLKDSYVDDYDIVNIMKLALTLGGVASPSKKEPAKFAGKEVILNAVYQEGVNTYIYMRDGMYKTLKIIL